MDCDLNPEQCAFDDGVSRFAQATLADMGLLGIAMPVEDGGQGGALTDAVIAIQALAAVCPKSADVVQAGDFGAIRTFAEYASADWMIAGGSTGILKNKIAEEMFGRKFDQRARA